MNRSIFLLLGFFSMLYLIPSVAIGQSLDKDQDGIADTADNCVDYFNPWQEDQDGDGVGDTCDEVIKTLMMPKLYKSSPEVDVYFIENPFSIPFKEGGDRSGYGLVDYFPPFDKHIMVHDINNDGLLDIIGSSNILVDQDTNRVDLGHVSIPIYFVNKGNLSFEVYKNPNYVDYTIFHSIQNYDYKDLTGDGIPDFHLGGEHYHLGLADSITNQRIYNWLDNYANHKRFVDYSEWENKELRYYTIDDDGLLIDNVEKINPDEQYPLAKFASIHSIGTGDLDNDGDNDMLNFSQYDVNNTPYNFGYGFTYMKNDGQGTFERDLIPTNYFCGEGRFIFYDTDEDNYDEVIAICNDNYDGGVNPRLSLLLEFDNDQGVINFEQPTIIDTVYNHSFNQPDWVANKTLRNYHVEDLNSDGIDEIIILVAGMYSGLGGELPFNVEALSNLEPHNQIRVYNVKSEQWVDVTASFIPNEYNYSNWYSNHMAMSFSDIDGNGTLEMIPYTTILNPVYEWNNTTNFQFFTYNTETDVFDFVSLPSYSKMFPNDVIHHGLKQNNFELADLDNDGEAEIIKSSTWTFNLNGEERKNYLIILKEKDLSGRIAQQTVNNQSHESIPNGFLLDQNYPNPFNPKTTISYSIPRSGMVKLTVYDITGRLITTLVDEVQSIGNHSVQFDASNLSSGLYLYALKTDNHTEIKKMTLVK